MSRSRIRTIRGLVRARELVALGSGVDYTSEYAAERPGPIGLRVFAMSSGSGTAPYVMHLYTSRFTLLAEIFDEATVVEHVIGVAWMLDPEGPPPDGVRVGASEAVGLSADALVAADCVEARGGLFASLPWADDVTLVVIHGAQGCEQMIHRLRWDVALSRDRWLGVL